MSKKHFLVALLLSLGIAALACESLAVPTPPNNVLLQDDFSNLESGWDRKTYPTGSTDYAAGGYLIAVHQPGKYLWANPRPNTTAADVSIVVRALKVDGEDDNDYGILCRYQDENNFYALLITSDGYFGIRKRIEGEMTFLGAQGWTPSAAIKQGNGENILRVDCIGNTLMLYVNGQLLAEVEDDALLSGGVGLFAGTLNAQSASFYFDDFFVAKP